MFRLSFGLPVLIALLFSTGWLVSQEKKEDPPTKLKGMLPANWKKLGLTETQVQQVYKIQGDYRTKIDKLTQEITKLKADEKAELDKVLTPAQKDRLKEILIGGNK